MTGTVCERLREQAVRAPGAAALVTLGTRGRVAVRTWAELDRMTARVADALTAAARRPETSVCLAVLGNGPSIIVDLVGMLRTDMPVAVASATAPQRDTAALRDVLLRRGYDIVSVRDGDAHVDRSRSPMTAPLPAESMLVATGGSAGTPKVVIDPWMRTVARRPRAVRPSELMNWRAGQRQLIIGPLYHAAPLTFFTEGLSDGNTLIVPQSFDAEAALQAIGEWQVEWLHATPYHLRHMAAAMRQFRPELSSVRGLVHLAAPCPELLKRYWIDALSPDRVFEMYGATEGIGITIARGDQWLRRPGTVGQGFFTEIRILGRDGRRLAAGQTGDVHMRSGPQSRLRYVDARDRMSVTADGFASVGDQGWLDAEGYLYLAARQLTRIQVGGETVDPGEVESVLATYPDVIEAAVVGVPDERLGEALVAVVVADGSPDSGLMKRYLRERLARYKVPRVVRFVDELPHTEAGKIDRRQLAELAGRGDCHPERPARRGQVPRSDGHMEAGLHG